MAAVSPVDECQFNARPAASFALHGGDLARGGALAQAGPARSAPRAHLRFAT